MTEEPISLRDYIDMRIEAADAIGRERSAGAKTAVDAALAASEKAVLKAEAAQEKRMESLNEFRAAMMDQQKALAPKAETDLRFEMLDRRVSENSEKMTLMGGRAQGVTASFATIVQTIASAGAVITVAILLFSGKH